MAFLTVKPPVNAQFAKAYNAIVEGCWKRGFGIDLKKKKIGGFDGKNRKEHEITSEDMQQLRDIIQKGKDQFFDRSICRCRTRSATRKPSPKSTAARDSC